MAVEISTWRPEPMSERVVVRCYSSYQDARRAVDTLEVGRIPRKRITVFGRGLRWREAFTVGRMVKAGTMGGAALGAAVVTKRDRAIPETGHVDVDHYDVLVELDHADRARAARPPHVSRLTMINHC